MLSADELINGRIFVLKLWDATGVPCYWVERLRGDIARRWYDIYRRSDWARLRAEAGAVLRNRVSEGDARDLLDSRQRCLFVHTVDVTAENLNDSRVSC